MTSKSTNKRLVVIVGPTASGKSALAIKIAQKYNGEIISADSRQVYRRMDIGTGKVTKKEQKLAKHHLIDIVTPKKQFTADDFKKMGEKAISDILNKGKTPIIVGGTGFYIDILLGRMAAAPVPPNKKLRAKLEKQSAEQLFRRLTELDPRRAGTVDRHNKIRLVRALEIIITTGKPVPRKAMLRSKYKVLWLGLNPENIQKRIGKRLNARLKQGMVKEVKQLIKSGVNHKRLQALGLEYRWASLYLQNKISYQEMRNSLLKDIFQYSKRQMTWFKRNKEIHWIKNPREAKKLVKTFI